MALVVVHFVPLDNVSFEKAAQERLGVPVRIRAVHLALFPTPRLAFEQITIGDQTPLKIPSAKASPEFGSVWGSKKVLKTMEFEGATVPVASVAAMLWGKPRGDSFRIERVKGKSLKFDLPGMTLPAVDVDISFAADGGVAKIALSAAEKEKQLSSKLESAEGKIKIELDGKPLDLPFGSELFLADFSGKGELTPGELRFSEFQATTLGGIATGSARLAWGSAWSLEGTLEAKQIEVERFAAPLVSDGKLDGKGVFSMKAQTPEKLFSAARLEGNFSVQKGALGSVDINKALQGGSGGGGRTLFSELSGSVAADSGRVQLRNLRMVAGLLNATGGIEVDAQKNLSGRIQAELRAQSSPFRASLGVSGTLKDPKFAR
ncbi:MAG: hypothetical protein A3G81_27125 [Betaproteobacteria bacterium RIFCSPLOWO2_12_FULL_65_14]|nr:MAG: hypothetical protein A3G81_27125 [Betaproteobacteria bacterium RIFCSPLOWO2_12_FULL_65_14]